MKKTMCLVLAVALCLSLAACGAGQEASPETEPTVNEAVTEAIALIDALGEVSLDSLGAIEKAEQAYAALNPADQEQVTNYQVLKDARVSYSDRLYESQLPGEWFCVDMPFDASNRISANLILNADGTAKSREFTLNGGYESMKWSVSGGMLTLQGNDVSFSYKIVENEGYLSLESGNYSPAMSYLKDLFLQVELTSENVTDYFAWTTGSMDYDSVLENGEIGHHFSTVITLDNLLLDEGWYYFMTGEDFHLEYNYAAHKKWYYEVSASGNLTAPGLALRVAAGSGLTEAHQSPFELYDWANATEIVSVLSGGYVFGQSITTMSTLTPEQFSFGQVSGTICYVNSDYAEATADESGRSRFLRLICGNWGDIYVGPQYLDHEY